MGGGFIETQFAQLAEDVEGLAQLTDISAPTTALRQDAVDCGTVASTSEKQLADITLTSGNFGPYHMSNGLTRLQTRFLGEENSVGEAEAQTGTGLEAGEADALGLVTFILDDIDWEDEVRIFMEERASFSPDAMTGMEANLRFAGPETMETRIFGRLTAWQNWIFQRPNAVGPEGALQRYGSGVRADYNMKRV